MLRIAKVLARPLGLARLSGATASIIACARFHSDADPSQRSREQEITYSQENS